MSTTSYFEEKLYPAGEDGRADNSKTATDVEVIRSNYFGDDQIYLRFESKGGSRSLHLTKDQARELAEGLIDACNYIGYDNT